ncbi:hypothetical protein QJS04_geneDACA014823 [Acorus gramineus]|uniref:Uncharacterized protein n=1 Tax=Acorus gramineus TaxID=55184 RepID=A0AAV9BNE6_ACOGR|nr:hypothetical protein QJS04_geneDACA014823 [Acorus gramineus]
MLNISLKHSHCRPLIEKMRKKLLSWQSLLLSSAGRLELAKTILNGLHLYWTGAYSLPKKTIKDVEKMIRDFLWRDTPDKHTIHHVNWNSVCCPKEEGGLGIKRISDWNSAATSVHFWDIAANKQSMWVKWIHSRYLKSKTIWEVEPRASSTSVWRKILAARTWIKPKVQFIIYNGENIILGSDPWIGGDGLWAHMGERLPLLFGPTKDTKLSKLINLGAWSKPHRWPVTFDQLWTEIAGIEICGQKIDELIWSPSKFGNLDLKEAWKELRSRGGIAEWSDWVWQRSQVPKHS